MAYQHAGGHPKSVISSLLVCIMIDLLFFSRTVAPVTRKPFDTTKVFIQGKDDPRHSFPISRIDDHLRTLSKPAVKTIQSSDGDTIDCVPIHQQLAFDHPKLKSHKLQKHPSSGTAERRVNRFTKMGRSNELLQLWHQNGSCPSATVPVRRTTAKDILRAESVERYGRKFHQPPRPISPSELPQSPDKQGHEHAIAYVNDNQYYGAQASINVWKPNVELSSEFSLSQIWLLAGSFNGDLNSIEAGWQVSPELYGDSNPRLFTYWTSDAYQATGCYNLLCSGFVQLSSDIAIGASISPVSVYNGSQYDIQILIWKDPKTGNWWMRFGENFLVGYWPAELFSHLTGAATMIEWGGEIVNTQPLGQHTTTQMGSGNFPQNGFSEASYFRNLGYVDATNQLVPQINLRTIAEHPNCYSIQLSNNNEWGDYFYYGGPGRNPNCP